MVPLPNTPCNLFSGQASECTATYCCAMPRCSSMDPEEGYIVSGCTSVELGSTCTVSCGEGFSGLETEYTCETNVNGLSLVGKKNICSAVRYVGVDAL